MVGGLVEQQQLRGVDQRAGQRDPALLAAAERPDRGVEALREAGEVDAAEQTVQDGAKCGVAGPLVLGPVPDELAPDGA
jgi:hypothetical protein